MPLGGYRGGEDRLNQHWTFDINISIFSVKNVECREYFSKYSAEEYEYSLYRIEKREVTSTR